VRRVRRKRETPCVFLPKSFRISVSSRHRLPLPSFQITPSPPLLSAPLLHRSTSPPTSANAIIRSSPYHGISSDAFPAISPPLMISPPLCEVFPTPSFLRRHALQITRPPRSDVPHPSFINSKIVFPCAPDSSSLSCRVLFPRKFF